MLLNQLYIRMVISAVALIFVLNQMMDLVEEIESYSPQTGQPKPPPYYTADGPEAKGKAPLIDPFPEKMPSAAEKGDKGEGDEEKAKGCMRFFKLAYYKEYFQVTEKDVLGRIKSAIVPPFNEEFIDTVRPNPDLYGPFWVLTTLVFLLGTVGNFSNYLLSKFSDGQVWNGYFFHLELVRYAVVAIYTFGAGVPLTLYFLLKFLSFDKITFPELACLYGYSLFCFIPATLLCIIPINLLQWVFLLYGFLNSSIFLIVSLKKHIEGIKAKHAVVFGIVGGLQLVLLLVVKLLFISLLEGDVQ